MSLKETIQPSEVLRTGAKIVTAGFLLAVPGIAFVTTYHHRELTHKSDKLHPLIKAFGKWEMRVYSPLAHIWAAVHRLHHSQPDVNLKPFLDIARAIKWVDANPDRAEGISIPECYLHLDPLVKRFSKADVLTIGRLSEERMKDMLGGAYEPPSTYTKEQLQDLLNPTGPRYLYKEEDRKHVGDYTQDEIEEIYLRDPHSPPLAASFEENGVQGVLLNNVPYYRVASHLYRARPDLIPEDLQTGEVVDHQKVRIRGFIEGSLVNAGLVLLARNKYEPKDFLKAVLTGVAINTVKTGIHIAGGNITNSLGHAGVMDSERLPKAIFSKKYNPILNPDGTFSTNVVYGGLLGRLINVITFDEVGGQDEHHKRPDKIEYTSATGSRALIDAPWGMILRTLARSRYFPFIEPGEGFDLKEGETRPDMPGPAVLLIQQRRVEQRAQQEQLKAT